jgi:kynurenine 3-monooxygenase
MHASEPARFVIIGGGLGGALAACYFGRAGHEVHLYEMRDDPRTQALAAGRSINLAISHRGIEALRRVGLADRVLDMAVPMPGRMIHPVQGPLHFQPYARDPSMAINSVSRNGLNELLLRAAGEHPNVTLHFNHKCIDVDVHDAVVELVDTKTDKPVRAVGDVIVSADGAFSAVRRAMHKLDRFDYSQNYLAHGYKELSIPAGPDGAFRIERNALHIWPRRALMMIALPNADGSFTCTIFWPFEGPNGFDAIRTKDDLLRYFNEQFPDAVPLMPALADDYFDNPTGALVTIRCGPWYLEDRVVLLGDACHAVVPFYGQGANAAFWSWTNACSGTAPIGGPRSRTTTRSARKASTPSPNWRSTTSSRCATTPARACSCSRRKRQTASASCFPSGTCRCTPWLRLRGCRTIKPYAGRAGRMRPRQPFSSYF